MYGENHNPAPGNKVPRQHGFSDRGFAAHATSSLQRRVKQVSSSLVCAYVQCWLLAGTSATAAY
jgi:hypothetical protein